MEFFSMSMGAGIAFLGSVLALCTTAFGIIKFTKGTNGNGKINGNGNGYVKEMSEMRIECGKKMNDHELKLQRAEDNANHFSRSVEEINNKLSDVFSLINGLNQNVIDVLKVNGLKYHD